MKRETSLESRRYDSEQQPLSPLSPDRASEVSFQARPTIAIQLTA